MAILICGEMPSLVSLHAEGLMACCVVTVGPGLELLVSTSVTSRKQYDQLRLFCPSLTYNVGRSTKLRVRLLEFDDSHSSEPLTLAFALLLGER